MQTMSTKTLAAAIGTLGFALALSWQALAGSFYFDQYVAPNLKAQERVRPDNTPPLYDPTPLPPLYPTSPDRTVRRYTGHGFQMVAGDVTPAAVTTDWDDRQRPELCRISFAP